MIAEDLNQMKNDGPDDDFIIKSGSVEESEGEVKVEDRLEAAGIEVPQPQKEAPDQDEQSAIKPSQSDCASSDEGGFYIVDDSEPDIDESEEELFAQIDAFRQKASMITALIREKQHRMDQLEEQLHEKEVENLRYQQKMLAMKKAANSRNITLSKEIVAEAAVRAANEAVSKSDDKMAESLKSVEDLKGDIYEKIHDENVRVYRNIQDFMKERDDNDERFNSLAQRLKENNSKISVLMVITILNLMITCAVILTITGVI